MVRDYFPSAADDLSLCGVEIPEVLTTYQSHDSHVTPRDVSLLRKEHGYSAQLSVSDDLSMCNIETPEASRVFQSHDCHVIYTPESPDNHVSHTSRDGLPILVQQPSPSSSPQYTSTPEARSSHSEISVDQSPSLHHSPSSHGSDDSDADTKLEQCEGIHWCVCVWWLHVLVFHCSVF